jgi:VIT1/CCC1 family predicted Fe2+/Mn2+ transporter
MKKKTDITPAARTQLIASQKDELAGYHIYKNLAEKEKDPHNKEVLLNILQDKIIHYDIFKEYTSRDVKPSTYKIKKFEWLSQIFGLTFGLKLLERNEARAQEFYADLLEEIPEIHKIIEDEERHEIELIYMLNEEKLNYVSSALLGLNDALVSLTGALAGFTLSIQDSRTIALLGLITGISAAFSMAASEYLSNKAEADPDVNPLTSAVYAGLAYLLTVFFLIIPFLLISNFVISMTVTLGVAILIIAIFNYYICVSWDYNFGIRFLEMAGISIGVAAISFLIGFLANHFLGLNI